MTLFWSAFVAFWAVIIILFLMRLAHDHRE